jgi:hypothetical protein
MVMRIDEETQSNKKQIVILVDENQKNKIDIEKLFGISKEFRTELNELSEKVTELLLLKKEVEVNININSDNLANLNLFYIVLVCRNTKYFSIV